MQTSKFDAVVLDITTVEIACAYSLAVLSATAFNIATFTQQYQTMMGGES
ncbi:MAG: hypothetical protein QNJ70_25300 [Xenococcaceae cyanobacterium MO_207.B15]|nr:hypothetical protein [Xenococcaceae cyanobacterium MO_207.B15]